MIARWNSAIRRLLPARVKSLVKGSRLHVRHRSAYTNIYHCCVHKTASQWIRAILCDSRVYKYSGLLPYYYYAAFPGGYDPKKITETIITEPFPSRTIVTPLYIDFENFAAIPKPEQYRTFFVMRDPRDIVVSFYFSVRYSHKPMGEIPQQRDLLNHLSFTDGLLYIIEHWHRMGYGTALRSWVELSKDDENVLLLRFEELTSSNKLATFKNLFSHCDICMPEQTLRRLLEDYRFERLSGRRPGEEDRTSQYRKGIHGDWKNYFDETIKGRFKQLSGDLLMCLGYESSANW